jgi:pyridoxamine 5'-phosphate oxidase
MANFAKRNPLGLTLCDLREEYRLAELNEANCASNPIAQFQKWFEEAQAAGLKEPNAMTLATATIDGRPSARIVLLKEVVDGYFVFYTNYESRKGRELEANPGCALTFYWAELERQVRIEGFAARVSPEKSEEYFRSRPRGSRLGAWVSRQSNELSSRKPLEKALAELETKYTAEDAIPMPDYWGGYSIAAQVIEFWQGRTNRLHDRIVYRKLDDRWLKNRLSP